MNPQLLTMFLCITAVATIAPLAVLVALYVCMNKTRQSVQLLSRNVEENVLPLLGDLRILLSETGPKLRETIAHLNGTSAIIRQETERLGLAANEIATRVRLQAMRVDGMVTRTLDRVEHTGETLQRSLRPPVRQISGLTTGIAAAIAYWRADRQLGRKKSTTPEIEVVIAERPLPAALDRNTTR
jgi:methyl-accepting chemotaxis protein